MTDEEIRARTWAIVAAVADGRGEDVDPLLDDLDAETIGHVVTGLASVAVAGLIPRLEDRESPRARAHVADAIRAELLERAAKEQP